MLSTLLGLQSLLVAIRENYMAREIFEYWIMWWIFWTIEQISVIRGGLWFHCRIISEQCLPIPFASFPLTILWAILVHLFYSIALVSHSIIRYFHCFGTSVHRNLETLIFGGVARVKTTSERGSTMSCCRPAAWRGWTGRTGPPPRRPRLLRSSTLLKYE